MDLRLKEVIQKIQPANEEKKMETEQYLDAIAKPLKSLGMLEDVLIKLGGIGRLQKQYKPCVAVMCADNGVVCEGVTQTGSEVTAVVAGNMTRGQSTVCIMGKTVGVDVYPYDCGMLTEVEGVEQIKVMSGTKNLYAEPAMTKAQAEETILRGVQVAYALKEKGYDLFAVGEMGIGNTTTSAAVASVLTGCSPEMMTGKGAGLSNEGLKRKIHVIETAIALHKPATEDVLDVLSKVGGLDIAAMAGVYLGCASMGMPVIMDGYISGVAALVASKLAPACVDYMIPSHLSKEPGAIKVFESLGIKPLLSMGMALGEGTGAVTMIPLIHMATAVYFGMPTFGDIGVEAYKKL